MYPALRVVENNEFYILYLNFRAIEKKIRMEREAEMRPNILITYEHMQNKGSKKTEIP